MSLVTHWNACSECGRHTLLFVRLARRRSLWRHGGWRGAEKGPELVSPFELKTQPNTCGVEAGCIKKPGFGDMLLTDVMAASEELDAQERNGVMWSTGMGSPRAEGWEIFLCWSSISPDMQSTDSFVITIITFKYCLGNCGLQGSLQTSQPYSANSDWPQGCIFWLPMHSLEAFSPVFHWRCDHKGVLSVRDNFYRSRREPLHPFPGKDERSPLKVTQGHAEQGSVLLPLCPLPFLGAFLCALCYLSKSHVTAEVLPSGTSGWQQNQKRQTGVF